MNGHLVTFLIPSREDPALATRMVQVVPEGQLTAIGLPSEFLIAAGQRMEFVIAVSGYHPLPDPGDALLERSGDWRHEAVPLTYDYSVMPSGRPLSAILADVVRHGVDNPTHGTNCACLDAFVWEVRAEVSKAVPPDRGIHEDVHLRVDGRFRIAHVLRLATRDL